MSVTEKIPPQRFTEQREMELSSTPVGGTLVQDDGTRALLQAGFWITLAGILALIATKTLLGGIGHLGPHTNGGWLSFMFALMGIPFGLMLLVLGSAKWLRNRRLRDQVLRQSQAG